MGTLNSVVNGLTKFIDLELLNKIQGLNKWIVGAGVSMALSNAKNIFDQLKENDFIKMLSIVNENEEIDIDKIYRNLIAEARKSTVTVSLPMVGNITLTEKDVEKLMVYIRES